MENGLRINSSYKRMEKKIVQGIIRKLNYAFACINGNIITTLRI